MATSEQSPTGYQPGLLPADSLANLLVLPGSEEAQQMTVGSGRRWLPLLNVSGPIGCWLKMCLESSRWNSTRCYLTWSASTTPHGRLLFRLVPSMPNTDVNEFGLWATPSATDSIGSTGGGQSRSLRTDVRMWPTPRASSANGASQQEIEAGNPRYRLETEVMLFPTPTARDWRSGKASQATMDRNSRPLSEHVGGSLNPIFVEWLMGYPEGWTDLGD